VTFFLPEPVDPELVVGVSVTAFTVGDKLEVDEIVLVGAAAAERVGTGAWVPRVWLKALRRT